MTPEQIAEFESVVTSSALCLSLGQSDHFVPMTAELTLAVSIRLSLLETIATAAKEYIAAKSFGSSVNYNSSGIGNILENALRAGWAYRALIDALDALDGKKPDAK